MVTPEGGHEVDLLIADGRIAALGEVDAGPDRTIDARGKYVLPGCIDVHTHMDLALVGNFDPTEEDTSEFKNQSTADDFASGTLAAAHGGTTTIIDFAEQAKGQTMLEGVEAWHRKLADAKSVIDVGFHLIVRELGDSPREEMAALKEAGVTSLKLFMAYKGDLMVDDAAIWEAMNIANELDLLVMVHAENGDVIDSLVRGARAAGQLAPPYHAATRPAGAEDEAVGRATDLAELAGCALYVVHVSSARAADRIAAARLEGRDVWGETCTQYLTIDESDLDRPDFEGAKFVFTPPPRTEPDRERLWRALATDVLSVVSSDHSPAPFSARKELGGEDFSKIPNGAGGVEERLMVIHHNGVNAGRISLNRMVELLSANPAKLFGLYPQKGSLAPGADADIVIFDPEAERELNADNLHSHCDYSIYDDTTVRGAPETVLVRGEVIVEAGKLVADPGHGRFVRRPPTSRTRDTLIAV